MRCDLQVLQQGDELIIAKLEMRKHRKNEAHTELEYCMASAISFSLRFTSSPSRRENASLSIGNVLGFGLPAPSEI
jgi:hypothetical protein